MLNLFDGTGFSKNDHKDWTGLKVIDEEPNEISDLWTIGCTTNFMKLYWDWKKIRGDKNGN